MSKRLRTRPCPHCKKPVRLSDPEFPFCSERCRLVDLGKWASGEYVISSPVADPDSAEGLDLTARKKPDSEGEARQDDRGQNRR